MGLSFVDLMVRRLPDRLTMPALVGAAAIVAAAAVLTSANGHLLAASAGAVALGGFYLVIVLTRPTPSGLTTRGLRRLPVLFSTGSA